MLCLFLALVVLMLKSGLNTFKFNTGDRKHYRPSFRQYTVPLLGYDSLNYEQSTLRILL